MEWGSNSPTARELLIFDPVALGIRIEGALTRFLEKPRWQAVAIALKKAGKSKKSKRSK
jgi:hypothetical protein